MMLAANNGHSDLILILIQKEANLDLFDAVSVCVDMSYYKAQAFSF